MTRRKSSHYSDAFKLQVLSDYYCSGLSEKKIAQKWNLGNHASINQWRKIWPIDSKELSLPKEIISMYHMGGKDRGKSDEQILQERITGLEKSLAMERLRCRALEKVIEIAEREEGISILKKDGVKQ
jgi:transposase-like protein